MCRCNVCGREVAYDVCEFCLNKDRLFRLELVNLFSQYGHDIDKFNQEYRKLLFKYDNSN